MKITVAGVTFDGGWNIIDAHGISTGISGSSSTVKNAIVKNLYGMSVMGIFAKTIENVSVKDSRVGSGDSTNTNQINFIAVEISPDGTAVNVTIDGVTALVTERPQYGSGIYPVILPEGRAKLTDSTITNISATGPFVTKGGSTTEYLTNFTVTGVAFMGMTSSFEEEDYVLNNISISNITSTFRNSDGTDSAGASSVLTTGIALFRENQRPTDTFTRNMNNVVVDTIQSNGPAFGIASAVMSWQQNIPTVSYPAYVEKITNSTIRSVTGDDNSAFISLGIPEFYGGSGRETISTSIQQPLTGALVSSSVTLNGSISGNLYENGWTQGWVGQQSGNPISVSYAAGPQSAVFEVTNASNNITLSRQVSFIVGSAPSKSIVISGNFSLENNNEATGNLSAAFTDGSAALFNWTAVPQGVISITSANPADQISYAALTAGTVNITASYGTGSDMVSKTVLVTVYNVTKPQPIEEPTVKENGNISITAASGNTITVDQNDPTKAVITDAASGAAMIITFQEPQTGGTSVEGNVTDVKVAYVPDVAVVSPQGDKVPTSASYQLNLSLSGVTATLPVISPAYNTTAAALLLGQGYTAAAMITASAPIGHDLSEINGNISTGGILLDFTVPKAWVDAIGRSKIKAFHVKNGQADMLEIISMSPDPATDPVTITVRGHEFSTIALAGFTAAPPTLPVPPVSGSGSGNSDYTFRVLFETSGGSFVQPATGLSSGGKISEPSAPTKSGYTFGGWYTDTAGTKPWDFTSGIPGDMTLYAKWLPEGSPVVPTSTASP